MRVPGPGASSGAAAKVVLVLVAALALALAAAGTAAARTVWLCRPGQSPNPCNVGLATTVFSPTLHRLRVIHPARTTALDSGNTESPRQLAIPVNDVRAAFAAYLRRYNHGRGFVLIGHSQGSFVLEQLIAKDIDAKPAVRKRLVSAILLGGNVLVKRSKNAGGASGTFRPAARPPSSGA